MFHTRKNGRVSLPAALFDDDQHCWNYVSLEIWAPWFIVTVQETEEADGFWDSTQLLHQIKQLIDLTERSDRKLSLVQLVQTSGG